MNSRAALLFVATLFIISPIAAWMMHAGIISWDNSDRQGKNNGELIHPARPLSPILLQDWLGGEINDSHFEGQWTMLEIAADPCDKTCIGNIYKMRQVRLALGKDAYRVQRVVISAGQDGFEKAIADNPGTFFYQLVDQSAAMLRQFPDYIEGDISSIAGRLYIIDPLGNLMMRYPAKVEPTPVLKDLRQLLKATWIRPKS